MRKVLFLVATIILFSACSIAFAELIDLSSLSYTELVDLSNKINAEMKNRPEWQGVKVPAGTWTVGIDIPEGEYSIRICDENKTGSVSIWGKAVDDYVTNGGCVYPLVFGYDYTVYGKAILKEGYIVSSKIDTYFCPPLTLGF